MPTPGEELSTLDFESMIGGPLIAVVNAQAQAAMTSVDYIKGVGFTGEGDDMEPIMVSFSYSRDVETTEDDGTVTVTPTKSSLTVPILTMLPIPFLRVEETTIDINAKIVSTQFRETNTSLGLDTELQAKAGYGPFSAKLKVNFSYQKSTQQGSKVERTYTMAVHVRAVQDEMPAGTERLLGILENTIKESPSS
jgi:hypothetical protein